MRPVGDLDQRFPENFLRQVGADHVGAGNDQRIQSLLANLLEAVVVAIDVRARLGIARQGVERKRVHEKLRDRVAFADQPEELLLGRAERRVGHHVEQPDMQLANILVRGEPGIQYAHALAAQAFETR